MGELSKKVGKRIKDIREKAGIKQYALAEKLNMEPSNLTRIENGNQLPKEENLIKIAEVLNVEIKDLFTFPNEETIKFKQDKIKSLVDDFRENEIEFLYNFVKLYKLSR